MKNILGKLNIASMSLLVGAIGQYWFYGRTFSHIPDWLTLSVLLVPWLVMFTLTLCKRAPFGARQFRYVLVLVMAWYALATIFAEIIQFVHHLPADGGFSITVARVIMYFGLICFIPFVRAYLILRQYESGQASTKAE